MNKTNTKNICPPEGAFSEIAKTYAEAFCNVHHTYGLSYALAILHANGFPSGMNQDDLLKYLEECGLVLEDGTPTALALEKGVLFEEAFPYTYEDGSIIPDTRFSLTGYGLIVIVASLIAARKEEQA